MKRIEFYKCNLISKLIIGGALFVLLCSGDSCCKKETDYPTYYLDQELKDYVDFPVGSYWIYKDSASSIIDSVYLYEKKKNVEFNNHEKRNYEYIDIKFNSSYYKKIRGIGSNNYDNLCYYYSYFENKLLLHSALISNVNIGFYHNSTTYENYLDTLNIGNIKFSNIKKYNNPDTKENKFYWSKYIGLVKRKYNDTIWELVKYHINK